MEFGGVRGGFLRGRGGGGWGEGGNPEGGERGFRGLRVGLLILLIIENGD